MNPIDSLFPMIRREVLGATYAQPDRWWYMSELAAHIETTPSSLQRELHSLVSSGILRLRRDGKRVYFQADEKCPIFDELRSIVTKTLGVADALGRIIAGFEDRITCAFIFGTIERLNEDTPSDVDLMLIGTVALSEISAPLLSLEKKYKLEFDITCQTPADFAQKKEANDPLVSTALREQKLFLKGNEDVLDALTH